MTLAPNIVGIGGTTRPSSSSELLIKRVLSELEKQGANTKIFGGAALAELPHYAPEKPIRSSLQKDFVDAVRNADGLVIGSPSYHGGISGLVKNAIDLLEDLRDDENVYCTDRPVGIIVTAAGWQGCGVTIQSMRGIIHALRGWPTPLGITVNTLEQKLFDADGELIDTETLSACKLQAEQIMDFIKARLTPDYAKN